MDFLNKASDYQVDPGLLERLKKLEADLTRPLVDPEFRDTSVDDDISMYRIQIERNLRLIELEKEFCSKIKKDI
jgi:hypothetical protein